MHTLIKYFVPPLGVLAAATAHAVPTLQLNITGGTYDSATETIILNTGATSFSVNAYLKADGQNTIGDSYGLSIALVPKTGPAGSTLGSFTIGGNQIDVTSEMVYGVPPLETVATQLQDPGDLATHGIFETFFYENVFSFVSNQTTASVNTQDTPGYNPVTNPPKNDGFDLYYVQFAIDAAFLAQATPLSLHFDLYNRDICVNDNGQCNVVGDVDQSQFAPFSHDAEWRPGGGGPGPGPGPGLPEPTPLALIGLGGLLVGWMRRRPQA